MNSIFRSVWFVRFASQISVVALLFGLSGCASSVTPRSSPDTPLIAEADLPAGWTAPRVVLAVAPVFPNDLKRAGIEGEVRLMCLIGETGEVRHIAQAEASNAQFVEPAKQALKEWRFTPGSLDGQPVAMSIMIPIRFNFVDSEAVPARRADLTAALIRRP